MADQDSRKVVDDDVQLLKRTKISVFVDEALSDILVVTFEFGVKIFRGVLLDSTKRNLPCGVTTLNPAFNTFKPDDDLLYSVNQRFAYTEPHTSKNKKVHISTKYKTNKMTVRLRPRQVLCSKCKGICNENSENVTRKRKNSDSIPLPIKRGANAPITRSVHSETNKRRLHPLTNASCLQKSVLSSIEDGKHMGDLQEEHSLEHSEQVVKSTKRPLKRRRTAVAAAAAGVGSSAGEEEDDSEEETSRNNNQNKQNNANIDQRLCSSSSSSACINTRTIKISYGPQGEGTVLKIPAQIENLVVSDQDSAGENIKDQDKMNVDNNKAARKALKKAKKEARKKVLSLGGSPRYSMSPRYTVGSASPRHGLGATRYNITSNAACDVSSTRRKKHKVKHKKRHREDKEKKHKEAMTTTAQDAACWKEQIVAQKLSINLKRLHNTYTSCPRRRRRPSVAENDDDSASSSLEDLSGDQVPNFPPSPLVVRPNAQTANAVGANGCRLFVGDVVWGKIHGFPWWPGKILSITCAGAAAPQAHVSWYGSPTSSLIQCDQLGPFLENFKIRYNKKKRGPYKEAVKLATTEARENAQLGEASTVSPPPPPPPPPPLPPPPPSRNIINVVPPALASPREINVVS